MVKKRNSKKIWWSILLPLDLIFQNFIDSLKKKHGKLIEEKEKEKEQKNEKNQRRDGKENEKID